MVYQYNTSTISVVISVCVCSDILPLTHGSISFLFKTSWAAQVHRFPPEVCCFCVSLLFLISSTKKNRWGKNSPKNSSTKQTNKKARSFDLLKRFQLLKKLKTKSTFLPLLLPPFPLPSLATTPMILLTLFPWPSKRQIRIHRSRDQPPWSPKKEGTA